MPEERHEHSQKVKEVFRGTASRYDLLNTLLSLGIDRIWRRKTVRIIQPAGKKILDLCAGTGELSFEMLRQGNEETAIIASDFSKEMLEYGEHKAKHLKEPGKIQFLLEDATNLGQPDNFFDAVTIAFGIRNIAESERHKALKEFFRVTRSGGQLVCLEFTHPPNIIFSKVYFAYLALFMPLLARLISEKPDAYLYLADSIKKFPGQDEFSGLIKQAGWKDVHYQNLTFGVVAIHSAIKPVHGGQCKVDSEKLKT